MKTAAAASLLAANALALNKAGIVSLLKDNQLTKLANGIETGQDDFVTKLESDNDGWTIFGLKDSDFDSATEGVAAANVTKILEYHTSPDSFTPTAQTEKAIIKTLLKPEGLDGAEQALVLTKVKESDPAKYQISNGFDNDGNPAFVEVVETISAADNVVVHKISGPLNAPGKPSEIAAAVKADELVKALSENNLVETVDTSKAITIFIPNDEAFGALNKTGVNMTEALKYHIAPSVAYSVDLKNSTLNTLQGIKVKVIVGQDGSVMLDDDSGTMANVTSSDITTNNGVVHVIDKVLIPSPDAEPNDSEGNAGAAVQVTLLSIFSALLAIF